MPWGPATQECSPLCQAFLLLHCCLQGSFCLKCPCGSAPSLRGPAVILPPPRSLLDASSWRRTPQPRELPHPSASTLVLWILDSGNLCSSLAPSSFRDACRADTGSHIFALSPEPRGQALDAAGAENLHLSLMSQGMMGRCFISLSLRLLICKMGITTTTLSPARVSIRQENAPQESRATPGTNKPSVSTSFCREDYCDFQDYLFLRLSLPGSE